MKEIAPSAELFLNTERWIDVRAPVEFLLGSIPGAVNRPILNDPERAEIGTLYKREGPAAAIRRGYELVSGSVKEERVRGWLEEVRRSPEAVLFCFRGGQRSRIAQAWLAEAGCDRPLVAGGFKALRRFLRETLERSRAGSYLVIGGPTGSGKTRFLSASTGPLLDLEDAARHRGSAFGARAEPQPSQIDFENDVAVRLLSALRSDSPVLVEDESRMVGRRVVPEPLFEAMRVAPVVLLEVSLERRVDLIHEDYVLATALVSGETEGKARILATYLEAVRRIRDQLGGARAQEIEEDLKAAALASDVEAHRRWIRKLLEWYYDPLYARGLARRNPRIAFRGNFEEALAWVSHRR